jgi:hypothetical protein
MTNSDYQAQVDEDEYASLLRLEPSIDSSSSDGHHVADNESTLASAAAFNKSQVLFLSVCRLAEPIAFFCIIPFVNYMIEDVGYSEKDVGFYTGLIESLFSVVQVGHINRSVSRRL